MVRATQRPADETTARRRGIKIWHSRESTPLDEIMNAGVSVPDAIRDRFSVRELWADGAAAHVLYRDSDPDGCSITYVWFEPNCNVVRHSHNSDCAYLIVAGQAVLGRQVLNPGDGFFVPADAPYAYDAGPEGVEAIEFRPNSGGSFNMSILEDSPTRWEAMLNNSVANRELWRDTEPTFFPDAKTRPADRPLAK